MSGKKSRLAYSLAAMAALVALQAPVAMAAQSDQATTQVNRAEHDGRHGKSEHKRHSRAHQRDVAFMIPGYGPIGQKTLDALKLTDSQKQKVDAARAEQKALRDAHRNNMKSNMKARAAQLEEGKIEPREALQAMQAAHQEMSQRRNNVAHKWLDAWEALDAGQQEMLTKALADRYAHQKDKMQGHSAS
tara:strand:- start:2017 stop:2583 length:567 start_codon:yes stop_codon:yes gene_type:complete